MAEAPKTDDSFERGITIIAGMMIVVFLLGRLFVVTDSWGLSPGKAFRAGSTVVSTSFLDVLEYPSEKLLGHQNASALGVVLDGPKVFAGARRWFVDFATGPDGWVDESKLALTADAIKVGSLVHAINGADVYDNPGGLLLGPQGLGARGVVERGPVSLAGLTWWYVNFQNAPDGWVESRALTPEITETRGEVLLDRLAPTLERIWNWYSFVAFLISFFFIFVIVYCLIRMKELDHQDEEQFLASAEIHSNEQKTDPRFEKIHTHVSSPNPNDWRQAIIEADIILDELLSNVGYTGQSVGDKLKQVRAGDLSSVNSAWEAHKVRNDIAHRGSDFILTQREAQRVVGLYRQVFEELGHFK